MSDKKKILILAYYFPPCNSIGVHRPVSWARYFSEKGYDVTVACRHWSGELNEWQDWLNTSEQNKPEIINRENYKVLYLPYKKVEYNQLPIISKFSTFYHLAIGNIQRETDAMQYLPYLEEFIKNNPFDLIIATAEPYNIINVAYQLHEKFKIPYIGDYRDYEDHFILAKNPKNSLFKKIEFASINHFTRKWLKNARLVTSVCAPIANYLDKLSNKRSIVLTNGYEAALFDKLEKIPNIQTFQVSVLGTIYPKQSLVEFFEGVQLFIQKINKPKIQFNFIGLESIPEVAQRVRENMPFENTVITKRVSRDEALKVGRESHILFYPGFHQYTGFYSGKIFEYLGLKTNILISPGDEAVIDKLMIETKAGKVARDGQQVCDLLVKWYEEWLKNGELRYFGDDEIIAQYSRENQADKLLKEIEIIIPPMKLLEKKKKHK